MTMLLAPTPSLSFQILSFNDAYLLSGHELESDYMVYVLKALWKQKLPMCLNLIVKVRRVEAVKIGSEINNAATYGEHLQYYFFLVRDHQFHVPLRIVESFQTVDKESKEVLSEHLPITKHDASDLACDLIRPQIMSYQFTRAFEAVAKPEKNKGD
ncbi:hypothetical protein PWW31_26820 [Vibrio harveyi]|nr:hypothetical protein PWW31_26820 [Vibrio harveyi]